MGRLADCATSLDIIAQLHASLLLCSFLRMAAGELNKRADASTLLQSMCRFEKAVFVRVGCFFCTTLTALPAGSIA